MWTPYNDTVKNPVIINLFFKNNHLIEAPVFLILRLLFLLPWDWARLWREHLAARNEQRDRTEVVTSSNTSLKCSPAGCMISITCFHSLPKKLSPASCPERFWSSVSFWVLTERLVVFGTYCSCSPSRTSITGCLPFFMIISRPLSCTVGLQKREDINLSVLCNWICKTTVTEACRTVTCDASFCGKKYKW